MTFSHVNRRVHLYLGLFLLPWLFMYGLSSVPFAHTPFLRPFLRNCQSSAVSFAATRSTCFMSFALEACAP